MATHDATLDSPIAENIRAGAFQAEMEQRLKAEATARGALALFIELVDGIDPGTLETYHREYRGWTIDRWKAELPKIIIRAKKRWNNQDSQLGPLTAQLNDEKAAHALTQARLAAEQREADQLRLLLQQATRPVLEDAPDDSTVVDSTVVRRLDTAPPPQLTLQLPDATSSDESPPHSRLILPEQIPDDWAFTAGKSDPVSQRNDYEVKGYVLGVIGSTGRCSRAWLKFYTRRYLRNANSTSTVHRAIRNCIHLGWLEVIKCEAEWATGAPDLVRLTETGAAWYRRLFNAEPVASELTRLLDAHGPNSEPHAVLCIGTADQLERRGFQVQTLPPAIEFGEHQFRPDLSVVTPDGEVWHIECERATGSAEGRRPKWTNALTLLGEVYIVAPNERVCDLLVSEVLALGRRCRVHATDFGALQQRDLDRVWKVEKELLQSSVSRT